MATRLGRPVHDLRDFKIAASISALMAASVMDDLNCVAPGVEIGFGS